MRAAHTWVKTPEDPVGVVAKLFQAHGVHGSAARLNQAIVLAGADHETEGTHHDPDLVDWVLQAP